MLCSTSLGQKLTRGSPEAIELVEWRSRIIYAHVLLLNYALKFGYVYERWLGILVTILKKDPGPPKLHCLRAIHLYKWDWNLLMGVKWHHLLHLECDQKFINENCFGSMPGKECLDPVFVKELQYEIAHFIRLAVIMNDDDSKANYDWIHAFIANVVGRSKGLNKGVHCAWSNSEGGQAPRSDQDGHLQKAHPTWPVIPPARNWTREHHIPTHVAVHLQRPL